MFAKLKLSKTVKPQVPNTKSQSCTAHSPDQSLRGHGVAQGPSETSSVPIYQVHVANWKPKKATEMNGGWRSGCPTAARAHARRLQIHMFHGHRGGAEDGNHPQHRGRWIRPQPRSHKPQSHGPRPQSPRTSGGRSGVGHREVSSQPRPAAPWRQPKCPTEVPGKAAEKVKSGGGTCVTAHQRVWVEPHGMPGL